MVAQIVLFASATGYSPDCASCNFSNQRIVSLFVFPFEVIHFLFLLGQNLLHLEGYAILKLNGPFPVRSFQLGELF